jgi:hydroxymethylglutaryl-CoA lyase
VNESVRITEVAPRDGLQNEAGVIPTAEKAELVRLLSNTGVDEVEVTSFVSPKWIPQLGDATDLLALLCEDLEAAKPEGVQWSVLVPNERGMDAAIAADERARETAGRSVIDKVSVFTAASESFSLKNTNASIEETVRRFAPVVAASKQNGKRTRGYISCVVRCPYEGGIAPERVGEVCSMLLEFGIDEIDLGDTIGAATPETIMPVLLAAIDALDGAPSNAFGEPTLTLHLHDTFGNAAECVREALTMGVRSFDGAASGLGGGKKKLKSKKKTQRQTI